MKTIRVGLENGAAPLLRTVIAGAILRASALVKSAPETHLPSFTPMELLVTKSATQPSAKIIGFEH